MTSTHAIPEVWRQWLIHNRDRGCARQEIVERAAAKGFPLAAINAVLDTPSQQRAEQVLSDGLNPSAWSQLFNAPIMDQQHQPRAFRVATPHAQLYELVSLFSPQECKS